jgi:hypothetical protein
MLQLCDPVAELAINSRKPAVRPRGRPRRPAKAAEERADASTTTLRHLYTIYTIYHIIYNIYNAIYAHYNRGRIAARSGTSLFLVSSKRFEGFYREFLGLIHRHAPLFTTVNRGGTLGSRTNPLEREGNCHDVLTYRD